MILILIYIGLAKCSVETKYNDMFNTKKDEEVRIPKTDFLLDFSLLDCFLWLAYRETKLELHKLPYKPTSFGNSDISHIPPPLELPKVASKFVNVVTHQQHCVIPSVHFTQFLGIDRFSSDIGIRGKHSHRSSYKGFFQVLFCNLHFA